MTESEALSELRSFPISCLDFKEQMALDMAIEAMKKQIDGGWIPVEQKTPEDFTYVYATCISLVDNRKAWVVEGVYHSLTGWKELTPYISLGKAEVTAWMPRKFPAPYQKGE
jgi:hypothetical protein